MKLSLPFSWKSDCSDNGFTKMYNLPDSLPIFNCAVSVSPRQMGQVLLPLSLVAPHECRPCTCPQFRYTMGCDSGSTLLEFFLEGMTRVCSPTGHCGRPAFMSSRHCSSCLFVGEFFSPEIMNDLNEVIFSSHLEIMYGISFIQVLCEIMDKSRLSLAFCGPP